MKSKKYAKEFSEETGRVIGEMLAKTLQSENFKHLALRDFAAAYKEHTGKSWAGPAQFRIVEAGQGDPDHGLFEIPDIKNELNDKDLEKAAGGLMAITAVMPTPVAVYAVVAYGTVMVANMEQQ